MSDSPPVTAAILIIGNEILSGRTKDANLPWLAERLGALGIRVREARVVPDIPEEIIGAVNALRAKFTYVFTTGGIGPTHDDITAECIAQAFGVPLERNAEAVRRMEAHYPPGHLNEARLRMANAPQGAVLIDNPVSIAPGFQIENVFVMAGIPSIMQAMFSGLGDRLTGGAPVSSRTIVCALPEGLLAKDFGELQQRHAEIEMGSYPTFRGGKPSVSLVLRGVDEAALDRVADELMGIVKGLGGEPVLMAGGG